MTIPQVMRVTGKATAVTHHEIDVELFTFIERYATNLTRWDLLLHFGKDSALKDNATSIAQKIGRPTQPVQSELDELVSLGILRTTHDTSSVCYALAQSPVTRRIVVRLARDFSSRR